MITANPGFFYIELWIDDDSAETVKHPVIGWIEDPGAYNRLALKPVTLVHRHDDEEDWAVQYPGDQRVVCNRGGVHRTIGAWVESVKERLAFHKQQEEESFQRRLAEIQAKPKNEAARDLQ